MPTPRFGLPYIAQGQAQKEVTHNDALVQLDALVDLCILDRDLAAPPGSPADGDTYLVAASPTGAWTGQAGKLACSVDGAWRFYAPFKGLIAYLADEQAIIIHTGASWVDWSTLLTYQNLSKLGILTTADATNRLAVKSDAVLLSHDDVTPGTGDMRVTLNKSAAARDAGFILQNGFSTRALFGLLGDDDFTVKVTPDGSTFYVGFAVDRNTGQLKLPLAPKFSAYSNFDNYIAASTWTKVQFNNALFNDQNAFDAGNNRFVAPVDGCYLFGSSIKYKVNAANPTAWYIALYKNGAKVEQSEDGIFNMTNLEVSIQANSLLKLSAGDTIEVFTYFTTNDGYVAADTNEFWGHYVP